jgi:hypothetical protein
MWRDVTNPLIKRDLDKGFGGLNVDEIGDCGFSSSWIGTGRRGMFADDGPE